MRIAVFIVAWFQCNAFYDDGVAQGVVGRDALSVAKHRQTGRVTAAVNGICQTRSGAGGVSNASMH